MAQPSLCSPNVSEDIAALRRLIERIAELYSLDLTDKAVIGLVLDGNLPHCLVNSGSPSLREELPAMLRLLFRLEASSSEDLGISGLHRLWCQHREVLARFHAGSLMPIAS